MEVIKKYKNQIYFHLFLNLVIFLLITLSNYWHLPLVGFKDRLFYFIHAVLLQFSLFGYLYFLSINRIIFKILFSILFLFFTFISFWMFSQDVIISENIIHIALDTKIDIVYDLISFQFLFFYGFVIFILFLIFRFHDKIKVNQIKSPLLFIAFLSFSTYYLMNIYREGTFYYRLPYSFYFSVKNYCNKNDVNLKPVNNKLNSTVDSLNVVFILGESVRADHLQLNGYKRETTPLLSKRKNLLSFPDAYTTNCFTAVSIPQILTNATLKDDYKDPKYSLIDVLNKAEINTNWIGNQTPEKGYQTFINQSIHNKIIDPLHSDMSFIKDYDQELLPYFSKQFNLHKKQFLVMHMMGSHWWYETRYPKMFRKFTPVISSKYVPANTNFEMINSYDNTILYLDFFINQTIAEIEKTKSNTILIYLSDHGEMLGENNQWLHAQDNKFLTNPAMIIWYSDQFYKKNKEIVESLESNRLKKTDLDFFFHSILDLYQINNIDFKKSKSIFR